MSPPKSAPPSRLVTALFLLSLPLLLFHRSLFFGDAFLPADQLRHLAPWKDAAPTAAPESPWNVLRFDGITQFYGWRLEAARLWRDGHLPLYNPHVFAVDGGTPLWANSQSAPLYPPNLIFTLLGPERLWYGFGLSAALHLLLAAAGVYRFARNLGLSHPAATLSAATFSFCGPVIAWLSLPTFLCVTAWLPWLLLAIDSAHRDAGTVRGRRALLAIGLIGGLVLLGGHLQMALYVLLTATGYALFRGVPGVRARTIRPVSWALAAFVAGALAIGLAAPQVLPSLALSKISHRAGATASLTNYPGYVATALPLRNAVTFVAPNFFGHPNDNGGQYWNTNNYGEWALYVGILPLLLALVAVAQPWRRADTGVLSDRRFLAGLAGVALLLAFGSPLNLVPYFLIPGFSQTGNPGRVLVIAAFAIALLAGIGLDSLRSPQPASGQDASGKTSAKSRATLIAIIATVFIAAIGAARAAAFARESVPAPFSQLLTLATPGLMIAALWLVCAIALLTTLPRLSPGRQSLAAIFAVALTVADLLTWGASYNPSSPHTDVFPVTPGIAWLQTNAPNALIAPINDRWSITNDAPRLSALPPNTLSVYNLHDVAGYDSLFEKSSKDRIETATGADPCPPENGNLVFIKSVDAAKALGARYIVVAPGRIVDDTTVRVAYDGPDLRIYENPAGHDAPAPRTTTPPGLLPGFVLAALALLGLIIGALLTRRQ